MAASNTRPGTGPLKAPKSPELLDTELSGGVRAIIVRQRALPLVELRLAVPLGAAVIKKPAPSSVLSRSLFAGTDRHDRLGFAEAVESLGGHLGAHMDEDRFVIAGSVLAENFGQLLELLAEILTGATYPDDEVRADRTRAADETVIAMSQPEVLASQALRRRLFPGHPYSTPMAPPAALRRVNAPELRSLHQVVLDPALATLVLVGDIQPARARDVADAALGVWLERRGHASADLEPAVIGRPGPLELVARPGSVQSNLRLAGNAPDLADPDWPAASLAQSVLGGMFSSRITANLRERNGYAYSPRSRIRHARAGSTLVLAADVATAVTAAALVEARYEFGRLATVGITDEELELARRYLVGRFSFETATLPGLASTLGALAINGVGLGYLVSYPKAVIAATKERVDEAARRYLAPSQLITVVVSDPEAVADQLSVVDHVLIRQA
jgi:zinc protease